MTWEVQIIESSTGHIVRSIPCSSERAAEKVERGVLINLNHDKYHTKSCGTEKESKIDICEKYDASSTL